MSETVTESLEVRVDELEKQLAGLKFYIQDQVDPRFDDVQDDHRSLSERMNEYQGRVEKALSYANSTFVADLHKLIQDTNATLSAEFRQKFNNLLAAFRESIQQEIVNSKILAVRPATRSEIQSGFAIVVRQATPAEIRSQ